MKIAIVSDLHIGYERFFEDAQNQAREALEKAAEMADAILLPGDIFDKRAPKPDVMAQALRIFRDISTRNFGARTVSFSGSGSAYTDKPVIAISGTHERTAAGKENPLSVLALAGLVIDVSESVATISKGDEKVSVFGLGGVSEERVRETLRSLDPKPVSSSFNIFMFHQSVYEILPFDKDFIHYEELPKGYDLYVCGHIHSRLASKLYGKLFLIPGSTVLTQLKEGEQERKGFILFDTSEYKYEFVEINSRPFVVKHLAFSGENPSKVRERCEGAILDCISEFPEKKPIVKLYLEGTFERAGNELGLRNLASKYAGKAIVEIDTAKLSEPSIEEGIANIRKNRLNDLSVKDAGLQALKERLIETGFDSKIDYKQLFDILSDLGPSKKEKMIEAALQFLES
ncbi:metallophosphoesterase family protein [Candidatus Marsarchaeota archaeon]|nr:metallophosphoesterase family protein [Candidatus Marsarchaeota archaeon]MCL5404878.1 metallophosphoesterase family protein [Candidatus Marsarchaeota archaeon]